VHIVTKVFVILNLVVCLILSQYVWVSMAGNVQWREKYQNERDARHQDKNALEMAYNELLAQRSANSQSTSQNSAEVAALNATKQALEAWKLEAEQTRDDARIAADNLKTAVEPFQKISTDYNEQVVDKLQRTVGELTDRKKAVFEDRGDKLLKVAQRHDDYATKHEGYRRLETYLFLESEELENRLDRLARYRWLRPDLQRDLGDNGPVIFATVQWVTGNSLQINRGRRDGVELHQKFTIMRGGTTIAVVDVVEVQNETAECVIVDLVKSSAKVSAKDEAITRLFMSRNTRK
jgi:vacuolar-type H+-ATPase subunit I/STV1